MSGNFIISVNPARLPTLDDGLDLRTISFLGRVHIFATRDNITKVLAFIRENCSRLAIYCDCSDLNDVEDAVSILDHGASHIMLTSSQYSSLCDDSRLQGSNIQRLIDLSNGSSSDAGRYVFLKENISETYAQTLKDGRIAIIPANLLSTKPEQDVQKPALSSIILSTIRSDRADGLFPTVVVDEYGVCLGMVYSNEKSIAHALGTGRGAYHSRSRDALWIKGAESGDTQELISISWDCDADALQFKVRQKGSGFCHLKTATCFGPYTGLRRLENTLRERKHSAPAGSYTARLFNDPKLLQAKVMEEASELCEATSQIDVAAEAADLLYFALTKCTVANVSLEDIERNLDMKSLKLSRRKGDAKSQWAAKVGLENEQPALNQGVNGLPKAETLKDAASIPKATSDPAGLIYGQIKMRRYKTAETDHKTILDVLQRPSQRSTDSIMNIVKPIIGEICADGDAAVLKYTHKFEKATSLTSPVLRAPFPKELMQLPPETIKAIDVSFENIRRFHSAQKEDKPLQVETMPGIICSRFSRPIERVGLYIPGGTAVLPSTALMLGVPAMVAGCKKIVFASPPRMDGKITPEIVYIASKVGAESIVLAGGAQAVAAMAYGTESISKVDKILGPGNQFVTAAKMHVSNDTSAGVSIDMPAGPSEVLVIADKTSVPAFVASDLLSQAEHGTDSQVVLIAVDLDEQQLKAIEDELHRQAKSLPRVDIVRGAIEHSVTLVVKDIEEAMKYSNEYAPEHLILQIEKAEDVVPLVENAGSIFVGPWTPESVGDYSAGVNHSLPTYGYAKQYSGVNLSSFTKHITSSNLTKEGLRNVSSAVMQLAKVEELEAHRRAVSIRLDHMNGTTDKS